MPASDGVVGAQSGFLNAPGQRSTERGRNEILGLSRRVFGRVVKKLMGLRTNLHQRQGLAIQDPHRELSALDIGFHENPGIIASCRVRGARHLPGLRHDGHADAGALVGGLDHRGQAHLLDGLLERTRILRIDHPPARHAQARLFKPEAAGHFLQTQTARRDVGTRVGHLKFLADGLNRAVLAERSVQGDEDHVGLGGFQHVASSAAGFFHRQGLQQQQRMHPPSSPHQRGHHPLPAPDGDRMLGRGPAHHHRHTLRMRHA